MIIIVDITFLGENGTGEFINTVLSIIEAVTQHPAILMELHGVIVESILPPLAGLISSQNGMSSDKNI